MSKYPFRFSLSTQNNYPIQFGYFTEDLKQITGHTLIMGKTRSGKSNLVFGIRKSACQIMPKYSNQFLYVCSDAKNDGFHYFNRNLHPNIPIYFVYPPCKDTDVLHYGKEVFDVTQIGSMIDALIVSNPNAIDPFWTEGAKAILTGINLSLIQQVGSNYNFDTLIQAAFTDYEFLIKLLGKNDSNIPLINSIIANSSDKTRDSMFINLFVELKDLIFLAATFQRTKHFFTLNEVLLQNKAVLILGNNQGNKRNITAPINRLILARLFQYLSSKGTDTKGNKIFIEIDEFQNLGAINKITNTLRFTAGMGVSFILATQDLEGLQKCYSEKEINSLLSNCDNRLLLKMGSLYSADWFSKAIGNIPSEYRFQESINMEGALQGNYQYIKDEPLLNPSYLLNLPLANPENGVEYYHNSDKITKLYGFPVKRRRVPPNYINSVRKGDKTYKENAWSNQELTLLMMDDDEKRRFLNPNSKQLITSKFNTNIEKMISSLFTESLQRSIAIEAKNQLRKIGFKLHGD